MTEKTINENLLCGETDSWIIFLNYDLKKILMSEIKRSKRFE
jgi:hypothetical protein